MRVGSGHGLGRRRGHQDGFWFILVERSLALSAEMVVGPKLDEMAMVATYYFPGIHRGQSCRHVVSSEWPEPVFSKKIAAKMPQHALVSSSVAGLST
jgi:hypothetical protein